MSTRRQTAGTVHAAAALSAASGTPGAKESNAVQLPQPRTEAESR